MCSWASCADKNCMSKLHVQVQSENIVGIQLYWKYSSAGDGKQFCGELSMGQLNIICFKHFQVFGWNCVVVRSICLFLNGASIKHSLSYPAMQESDDWKYQFTLLHLLFHSKNCMALWVLCYIVWFGPARMQNVWWSLGSVTPCGATIPTFLFGMLSDLRNAD